MKWLIVQSAGEHQQNLPFRECYAWQYALGKNGIDADIWGYRHDNYNDVPAFGTYDVIFLAEQWEFYWLNPFELKKGGLLIQWLVDLHYATEHYASFTPYADICVHTNKRPMKDWVRRFPKKKHIWIPNGVDSRLFFDYKLPKLLDLTFVGSKGDPIRDEYIRRLEATNGLHYFYELGWGMIQGISQSKIHFNRCIGSDLNYRIFETIGLGTCLCTNYHPDLETLGFKDFKNCLLYHNIEECRSKIDEALANGCWVDIGQASAKFAQVHSYIERVRQLLSEIKGEA